MPNQKRTYVDLICDSSITPSNEPGKFHLSIRNEVRASYASIEEVLAIIKAEAEENAAIYARTRVNAPKPS